MNLPMSIAKIVRHKKGEFQDHSITHMRLIIMWGTVKTFKRIEIKYEVIKPVLCKYWCSAWRWWLTRQAITTK